MGTISVNLSWAKLKKISFILLITSIFFHPFGFFFTNKLNIGIYTVFLITFFLTHLNVISRNINSRLLEYPEVKIAIAILFLLIITLVYHNNFLLQKLDYLKIVLGLISAIIIGFCVPNSDYRPQLYKAIRYISFFLLFLGFINLLTISRFTFSYSYLIPLKYIGNKNSDAFILLLLMCFSISDTKTNKFTSLPTYLLLLAIILSGSRGITLVALSIYFFSQLIQRKKDVQKILLAGVTTIVTSFSILYCFSPWLFKRYYYIQQSARLDISIDAFHTMMSQPLLGIGYGDYFFIEAGGPTHSHTLFLSLGTGIGVAGLLLSFGLFVFSISRSYQTVSNTDSFTGLLLILSLFGASLFFDNDQILFFWIMLGMSYSLIYYPDILYK